MAINNNLSLVLQNIKTNSETLMQADLDFFCPESQSNKFQTVKELIQSFATDEDYEIQKISFN